MVVPDDYIVLRMDIEGAEYEVARRLINSGYCASSVLPSSYAQRSTDLHYPATLSGYCAAYTPKSKTRKRIPGTNCCEICSSVLPICYAQPGTDLDYPATACGPTELVLPSSYAKPSADVGYLAMWSPVLTRLPCYAQPGTEWAILLCKAWY
eukprot:2459910-Rhodomonas_salina.1